MRVFVAGGSGVMGMRLVPRLVAAGHEVAATTRSPARVPSLARLGAHPVVCDVYDVAALTDAVVAFGPDTVVHQLTDLPDDRDLLPERVAENSRIRRDGTRNLLAAAGAAGAERFVAQSVAWLTGESITFLEESVLAVGGVVLRYGQWYGPGTYHEDEPPPPPRVHVDIAAARTVALLDAPSGVYLVTDDG